MDVVPAEMPVRCPHCGVDRAESDALCRSAFVSRLVYAPVRPTNFERPALPHGYVLVSPEDGPAIDGILARLGDRCGWNREQSRTAVPA